MKKRLWIVLLLCYAAAIPVTLAETGQDQVKSRSEPPAQNSSKVPLPQIRSHIALIFDEQTQRPLLDKNANAVAPIASITKLMTAMVVLDAKLPLDERVDVGKDDPAIHKRARSRLSTGMTFTRAELLKMALLASENRAALALAKSYPGGVAAAVEAMNNKARELGMHNTRFKDPTGLSKDNVSTANDLVKMVSAASTYDLINQYSTAKALLSVDSQSGREMHFRNTNPLVRSTSWDIGVSKTGFISEAGLCLVMAANINQRPVIIVLLNSWGRLTRIGDANRIRKWMENTYKQEHRT